MPLLKNFHKNNLMYIILLAAILRFWGIWHGYPYSFYPDEAHFVKRALAFGSGDLNPHWFHKPAFLMYLLFFKFGILFVVGKISGVWHTVTEFAVFYIKNPGPFYMVGRITIVIFSLCSVFMTYLAGTCINNKRTGLIAALILAVSFGHVFATKDIKADIPCGFFTIVSAYFLIKFLKNQTYSTLFLSAVFAGIGTATKTYSIVMMVPIAIAVASTDGFQIFNRIGKKIKTVIYCILLFYFSYFICAPYNFIDPLGREATFGPVFSLIKKIEMVITGEKINKEVLEKNIAQNIENPEISLSVFFKSCLSYLKVLQDGIGFIALISAIAGFFYILMRRERAKIIGIFLFPVVFGAIAVFTSPGYSEIRHQVVLYPFTAILAAIVIVRIIERVPDKYVWITICILIYPVYGIVSYNVGISGEDTRNIAREWIEKTIPAETKILINENGPVLNISEAQLIALMQQASVADPKGQFTAHFSKYLEYQLEAAKDKNLTTYKISEIRFPWWKEREEKSGVYKLDSELDKDMGNPLRLGGVHQYVYYVENGYQYAIIQSNQYGAFVNPESKLSKNFPSFYDFYTQLFKNGKLIKEFTPQKGKTQGPVVKIYQIR